MKDHFIKFRMKLVPKGEQCKVKDVLKVISLIPKIQKDPPSWLLDKYQKEKDLYFCHHSGWGRVKVQIRRSETHLENVDSITLETLPWLPNEKLIEILIMLISTINRNGKFYILFAPSKKVSLEELKTILLDEYETRMNSFGFTDKKSREDSYRSSLKFFEEFE